MVDEYQNTNVENVYALGDVAGNKLLTPGTTQSHYSTLQLYSSIVQWPLLLAGGLLIVSMTTSLTASWITLIFPLLCSATLLSVPLE